MRLTRVYVDQELAPGRIVELPESAGQHLAKVLRARSGDPLIVFCGDGREYSGAVETVRGTRVTAAIGNGTEVDRESPLHVTLVQCIPRGDRMDFIVQKATELGVTRLIPVLSQRSVVRLDPSQAEAKAAHWRGVALNACEQCGRNRLPEVAAPVALVNYLGDSTRAAPRLLLDPDTDAQSAAPVIDGEVEIAVGPEGGFAPEELEAFRIAGFVRLGLGPRILRAETAAIAALTWLQTRFGDMRGAAHGVGG